MSSADEKQSWTTRDVEVIRLAAQGKKNREIAAVLGISVDTVKTHIYRLGKFTGSHGRVLLIEEARRLGYLDADLDSNSLNWIETAEMSRRLLNRSGYVKDRLTLHTRRREVSPSILAWMEGAVQILEFVNEKVKRNDGNND